MKKQNLMLALAIAFIAALASGAYAWNYYTNPQVTGSDMPYAMAIPYPADNTGYTDSAYDSYNTQYNTYPAGNAVQAPYYSTPYPYYGTPAPYNTPSYNYPNYPASAYPGNACPGTWDQNTNICYVSTGNANPVPGSNIPYRSQSSPGTSTANDQDSSGWLSDFLGLDPNRRSTTYTAIMDGYNAGTGSGARGSAGITIIGKRMLVRGSFDDLEGELYSAGGSPVHIHINGQGGSAAFPVQVYPKRDMRSGTFTLTATLSDQEYNMLVSGQYYIDVHTTVYPGGEISAQL